MARWLCLAVLAALAEQSEAARQSSNQLLGSLVGGRYVLKKVLKNRAFGHGLPASDSLIERSSSSASATASIPESFRYKARLGVGTYAVAYLAADRESNDEVVLKMLIRPDDRNARLMVKEECALMKEMQKHKALDPVGASRLMNCLNDHVDEPTSANVSDHQYIVLEYGGIPLSNAGNLNKAVAAKQLLQGVRYLSRIGVSHRDLKPDNCLVDFVKPHGGSWLQTVPIIKIIDFGLYTFDAKCKDPAECAADWSLYWYAPPEMRDESTKASLSFQTFAVDAFDVWSVGYTLFELMSGEYENVACQGLTQQMHAEYVVWNVWGRAHNVQCRGKEVLGPLLASALQGLPSNRGNATTLLSLLCSVETHTRLLTPGPDFKPESANIAVTDGEICTIAPVMPACPPRRR